MSAAVGKGGPALVWSLTPAALAKAFASLTVAAVALYCLHTGNRDRDPGRLVWAVALFFGALGIFLL